MPSRPPARPGPVSPVAASSAGPASGRSRPPASGAGYAAGALVWAGAAAQTALLVLCGRVLQDALGGRAPSWATAGALAVLALLPGVVAELSGRVSDRAVGERELVLRGRLTCRLFELGTAFRAGGRTGQVVSTATDGVERAAAYEAGFRGPLLASVTSPVVALLVLGAMVDWVVAGWLLLVTPVVPLAIGGFQRAFRRVSTEYRTTARRFSARFLDAVQGLPTATAFGQGPAQAASLARAAERLRRQVMRLLAANQLVLLVIDAVFALVMVTVAAGLAMARLRDGAIGPGEAVAVVLASTVLLAPLDRIGQFFYVGLGGRAAVREIDGLLRTPAAVRDREGVRPPEGRVVAPDPAADVQVPGSPTGREPGPRTGPEPASPAPRGQGQWAVARPGAAERQGIVLDGVVFAYPGAREPVLRGMDLVLPPGSRTALIGPSGGGKSTVAALVQAHLRPTVGRVLLGGHDLCDVPLDWARRQVAAVTQATFLFTGTIAQNLRLAAPDASEDRLWEALERAALADEVRRLPAGLSTPVGERGQRLSGGQAQRVAVARALLKDAPVLVLDEPTSQVDDASEALLVRALERACEGRTVLVVAHRLSTVAGVDAVAVLDGGRIAEHGPPAELRRPGSYYARVLAADGGRS